MAHGKQPGTVPRILAPSSPPCPGAGQTRPGREHQRGSVREETQQAPCSSRGGDDERLTPPVSATRRYTSRDLSAADMEDACSEYDNVSSDVEQDFDEVLRLNAGRYEQHVLEDVQHAAGDGVDESSAAAADRIIPRSRPGAEKAEGPPSDAKPHKAGRRFMSHCAPIGGDEAEERVHKVRGDRFFLSDGDEREEVLDGAKFIEDLEPTGDSARSPTGENEKVQKGSQERKREDDTRGTRNHSAPGAGRKCEPSHGGPKEKERQGKGRGRRATGGEPASGIRGCGSSSAEQRPKTSSKDCKRSAVRSKDRPGSSKHHHPPPAPRRPPPPSPPDTQKALPQRESPPASSPTTADSQEIQAEVMKGQQKESPEETQRGQEKPEQGEEPSTAMVPEEEPRRSPCPEFVSAEESSSPKTQEAASFPSFEDVPGPCEPEDLIDGIIFAANYLGCTQVLSDKNPSKSVRMSQAHEAVSHIKSQDEDSQMMTEVDLFISTKAVKVLNADTQETMMDSALRTISYIADIGSVVVLMARRRMSQASSEDFSESSDSNGEGKSQYRMICYVFESEDAQLIAQSIGQAFSVAYREFLRANGINPTDLSHKQYSDIINSQEMYHDDLVHFSNSENCKELYVEKQKGESLGVVIVESGWGSILPTVILASMLNSGPAARSGKLSVGDQIMSINDTSLVGLPLATCQSIVKGLKNQLKVKLSIVSCPPVTTVLIKRPDLKFQLGFSVQNGIICSLMRGGIAERGGVRVGHRIIEINGQSVVAMAHEKIVQTLSVSVGEVRTRRNFSSDCCADDVIAFSSFVFLCVC
ncbi:amyloid-beta A4 precursor protein-binding family A member 2 isoform X2 [Kryptolebias marmoratus]|uniref:amyloid-beta A4 precursor protein-binding family A member 2 isoform X2 n=1 Tax=Kryptolebias marmoratus TaxID=37003 RepID=UPI0018ACB417|nr:amyloid-beta A4 precursor protein-binding family A member 2 isoform X2 [Kryptolebias marmoratus]